MKKLSEERITCRCCLGEVFTVTTLASGLLMCLFNTFRESKSREYHCSVLVLVSFIWPLIALPLGLIFFIASILLETARLFFWLTTFGYCFWRNDRRHCFWGAQVFSVFDEVEEKTTCFLVTFLLLFLCSTLLKLYFLK